MAPKCFYFFLLFEIITKIQNKKANVFPFHNHSHRGISPNMSNLLVGSSNIVRFYKAQDFSRYRTYTVARCTEVNSFIAIMEEATDQNIVISVIENFVANTVRSNPSGEVAQMVEDTANNFLKIVKDAAIRLPDSKFAVGMPLQRPSLPWYQDIHLTLRSQLETGIVDMRLDNVSRIDCISILTQDFGPDQVHLTETSGKGFLNFILNQSETFFNAANIDLTRDDPSTDPTSDPSIKDRMDRLEAAFRTRNISDNLVMARLREELDAGANKVKEDRVVINGLVCKEALPTEIRAKTEVLREIAMKVFNFLIPDFRGKITFISQGKSASTPLPMVEARLDKVEFALAIRKAFAEKSKSKLLTGDYEKLFITNSVNLATRVRIDILKSIAQKVNSDHVRAYVVGFISRPVMHVRKVSAGSQKTLTFVDAIMSYGNLIRPADLASAYKRAGVAFDGQLQQNFVIMTESEREDCWTENSGTSTPAGTATTSYFRSSGTSRPYRGSDRGSRGYRGHRGYDRGARGSGQGTKRAHSPGSNRAEKLSKK